MSFFLQDLKSAMRVLLMRPLLTLVAVLTLGLGIGATTAVFSVFDTVLLKSLPYQDADRITVVREDIPSITDMLPITALEYVRLREQTETLAGLALADRLGFHLVKDGEPVRVEGALVTGNFFSLLGVTPRPGRDFRPEEDRPGNNDVVILSHGLWQRQFGADPALVGKTILMSLAATYGPPRSSAASVEVVGILPPDFRSPYEDEEVWMPIGIEAAAADDDLHFLFPLARLAPGVDLATAEAELDGLLQAVSPEHPLHQREGRGVTLVPVRQLLVRNVETGLKFLLGAAALVLLIASTNVANLLLIGAITRQREVALRTSLGATSGRLARQFLTESLVLACLGAIVGLALAWVGIRFLAANGPANIPRLDEVSLDLRVLLFTLGISAVAGLVAGVAPALRAMQAAPTDALKEGGRVVGTSTWTRVLRGGLVVLEVGLALVVLVGAGLLVRSFQSLQSMDHGFRSDHLLTLQTPLPQLKYPDGQSHDAFYRAALERVQALPGIQSASLVNTLPLSRQNTASGLTVEGRPQSADEALTANFRLISPEYFRTMGIPLLQGRTFQPLDMAEHPLVAIVNETAARRFWPGERPLQQRLKLGPFDETLTVVGVVGDVHHRPLSNEVQPTVYLPSLWSSSMSFVTRTANEPLGYVNALRAAIQEVDPEQPVEAVLSMEQIVADAAARPRFNAQMLSVLGLVALFLATVGIYGVMHYSVTQRIREVGVRMALGADRREVQNLILRHAAVLSLCGVAAGLLGAVALTRLMTSQLYGVSAIDPWTFSLVALVLVATALAAGLIPARRATRVDPVVALRYE